MARGVLVLLLIVAGCAADSVPQEEREPYRSHPPASSSVRPLGPYNDVQQRLREIDAQVQRVQDKMIEQERRQRVNDK